MMKLIVLMGVLGGCDVDMHSSDDRQSIPRDRPSWRPPELAIECGPAPVEPPWSVRAIADAPAHVEIQDRQWSDIAVWLAANREWTACIELKLSASQ